MSQYLGVSIALIVFMGLASGGMLSLTLMTIRKQQASFSLILALSALLALGGVFAAIADVDQLHLGLVSALVLLVLCFAIGYTLTTFSVLSSSAKRKPSLQTSAKRDHRTAVILLALGEPPEYEVKSAAKRLALADDPQDVPPALLRPFYLRDLRSKYAAIGPSPYRNYHTELARKVQSRLDSAHKVYTAFYNDQPTLTDALAEIVNEGIKRVVLVHVRVTNPPDPMLTGELLEGLDLRKYGVEMTQVGPLWDSDLLPQIYVRRALEAMPQVDANAEQIGLLLVGRGHPMPIATGATGATGEIKAGAPAARQHQEQAFQEKVRLALRKVGFDRKQLEYGWLRRQEPGVTAGLEKLIEAGAKTVLWAPSAFPADGVNTLYDIATLLQPTAERRGVRLTPLGAWNADDLAAEEIAARVRAAAAAPKEGSERLARSL